MKELASQDYSLIRRTVKDIVKKHGLKDTAISQTNPFLFALFIPVSNGRPKVVKACNELFHVLGVLPSDKEVQPRECGDYCSILVDEEGFDFIAEFNHPMSKGFKAGDEEYQFTLKAMYAEYAIESERKDAETKALVSAIREGLLKSKNDDGFLVLAGEFYDAIEAGNKKVEYRDFTKYNLKRTIGLRTIRLNRGYGSKGQPPRQMRWEVKKVALMDTESKECDPFNVPDGFRPTTIAVHLGKRLA